MESQKNLMLALIVIGVLIWGAIHAVGAYLFNFNPWRGVMVIVCVDGYLAFWLLMLALRRSRTARANKERGRTRDSA